MNAAAALTKFVHFANKVLSWQLHLNTDPLKRMSVRIMDELRKYLCFTYPSSLASAEQIPVKHTVK
jgi:hypothetical protein